MSWLFNGIGLIGSVIIIGTLVALMFYEARDLWRSRRRRRPRIRTAEQARNEAAFLREEAKYVMGSLSVETHEQRVARKERLEASVARLETEAERLDRA